MKLFVKCGWLLFAVLLLSGCGFHLRGTSPLDKLAPLTLSIDPDTPFTPLQKILRMALMSENIHVVPATAHSDLALVLENESLTQQALVIDRTAEVNQYLLRYTLTFKILDGASHPLPVSTPITVEREIAHDPNQTLAQNNEQAKLEAEMRRSAVQELLRRLAIASHQLSYAHT